MPELLTLQADFAAALRDDASTDAASRGLAGDVGLVQRRLAIHRANVACAAGKALSAAYPVIRRLVGDERFRSLARAFLHAHPSTSGDLTGFGAGLAGFLATFEPTASLPCLPDLARLEWAAHRAYGAADASGWNAAELAQVAPQHQAAIRLRWTPGLALVESAFPIVRLWQIHQRDYAGEFSVDWRTPETALVARDGFAVTVSACGPGDAAFLAASLAGAILGEATDAALARQADFDLGALLARALERGLLEGVELQEASCDLK